MSKTRRAILFGLASVNVLLVAALAGMAATLLRAPGAIPTPWTTPAPIQFDVALLTETATPLPPTPTPPNISRLAPLAVSPSPTLPTPTCVITTSGGLVSEIQAIAASMPGPNSEGMSCPTLAQMTAWEQLLHVLAKGDTASGCAIIAAEEFPYHIEHFTDLRFGNEQYLILRENAPLSVGWGTVVLRLGRARPLVIEAPHPLADENSEVEAAVIFRELQARALLVAGTHRCANRGFSPCLGLTIACGQQEPYRESDVAHAAQTMFQAAHRALVPCGGETVAIQLHTNSLAACPDVFISNGTRQPGPLAMQLYTQTARRCGDFSVDVADGQGEGSQGECGFPGDGVQAVYSNSCGLAAPPDACTGYASRVYGRETFLNIEQSPAFRQDYACLIEALKDVFE